jgi:hypothetical protein
MISRSPDDNGTADPIEEALSVQLKSDSGVGAGDGQEPKPEVKETPAASETPKEVQAGDYKGPDRRKIKVEKERRKDELDRANNLDLDFEYGTDDKKTKRLPVDEVKQTLKWLNENHKIIGSGLTINKAGKEYPQFGKLLESIISGSFNEKNEFNAEFAEKVLKAIAAKEEQIQENKDEIDGEIERIEKILKDEEIDPDSAQGEALKSSLASMKALKSRLNKALKSVDDLSKKVGEVEKGHKTFVDQSATAEYKAEVNRIAGMFDKEIKALTDKEKKDGYKFVDDGELSDFDAAVRRSVRDAVSKVTFPEGGRLKDEQFTKIVRESAKAVYEGMVKRREAIEQAYIKRKGGAPAGGGTKDKEIPESKDDLTVDSLTSALESMLPT